MSAKERYEIGPVKTLIKDYDRLQDLTQVWAQRADKAEQENTHLRTQLIDAAKLIALLVGLLENIGGREY